MTISAAFAVFRKEMTDHLRDRRSILIAMIYPMMGPLLLGLMFCFVGGSMQHGVGGAQGGPLVVPVVHPESAPALMRYLERRDVDLEPVAADARRFVKGGRLAFALILPAHAAAADAPLPVRLIANPSRFDAIVATGRIIEMLNDYQRATLRARLRAAGVPAALMNVLAISRENVGRAAGPSVILLSMIPPFLIFTLFTGGVHVLLDATCGERERGSFEPLMMNPVTRTDVLSGKLGATIVFTLMALAAQVVAFWIMLHAVPRASLGLAVPPGAWRLILVVSVCLPLVFLATATQLLISGVTRSMKEAQTYLGLLPLIPGLAGMVLALAPVTARPLLAAIPTFGQTVLMGQLVRSEFVGGGFIAITAVATLATTALLLYVGFRLYDREEILFPQ
ncbi:MAG TPA: ABC transporter permease subunit [Stellaceae bacterium]|nr:ABC transporter permease subunit [Stellaceae bacterium]